MPSTAASRRAFVAASAAAALAPAAEARKRKKKKPKPKPPEPLAFVAIAIQNVTVHPTFGTFVWGYQAQVRHGPSGETVDLTDTISNVAIDATQAETREALVWGARSLAQTFLRNQGIEVPEDRFAVVLL
jgi:hypothetical protein